MPDNGKPQLGTPRPQLEGWAQRMGEVPDLLMAAQLSLRPLAKGEISGTTAEARQIIGNACDLLHVALANVLEVTRNLPDLSRLNGESHGRAGADGHPPPPGGSIS